MARGPPAANNVKGLALKVLAAGISRNISPLPPLTAASAVNIEDQIVLPLMWPLLSSIPLPEISEEVRTLVEKQVRVF